MHLPPALLSSLRIAVGGTVLLGAACDPAEAAAPAEVITTTRMAQASAPARIDTNATVRTVPLPAATSLDTGATIEREPVLSRGRLRERGTTSALAFTGIEAAVTPDRATTFVAADPAARPKARRPKPVAATPVVREWSCGPCGRG